MISLDSHEQREIGDEQVVPRQPRIFEAEQMGKLLALLLRSGYELIGPTERGGAICLRANPMPRRTTGRVERRAGTWRISTENPGNLVNGANIAGFLKVANAMLDEALSDPLRIAD
jgi:hypothetical protein